MKVAVAFLLLLTGCSYLVKTPTTSHETFPRPPKVSNIQIEQSDVLLDARPFFYYTSSHLSDAYHEDIKKYFDRKTTWPKKDLFSESRVLARKGVDPKNRVLVLGLGKNGQGEECRMAWTLNYLGIPSVYFVKEDSLKAKRVTALTVPLKEDAKYWEPKYQKHMLLERQELLQEIREKKNLKVIDTRSEKDFLTSSFPWDAEVDAQVINMHWKQFVNDSDGRANLKIANQVEQLGIKKTDPIVVIDQDGIGASCAALALMDAGFMQVRLYAGGYNDLRQILSSP